MARCTVDRLMKQQGIEGVRRGRRCITTIPSEAAHKPLDLVKREFSADHPNQLRVADITSVAIDVFSRYIVGWRVLKHMQADFILDALEQVLWARGKLKGVLHHSDRGSQCLYESKKSFSNIKSSQCASWCTRIIVNKSINNNDTKGRQWILVYVCVEGTMAGKMR